MAATGIIDRVDHLVLTVNDIEATTQFYERVLGFEREVILTELKRSHFHVTNAAKALGLERSHLYKKAEQLGIDLRSLRNDSAE